MIDERDRGRGGARLRLGVIAGCMTHETGVPLSALFHRVLRARLKADHGVSLELRIARSFNAPYGQRLLALLQPPRLDAVLLHVRLSVARKSGVVALFKGDTHHRYFLHPFLFRRNRFGWSAMEREGFPAATGFNRPVPAAAAEDTGAVDDTHGVGFRLHDLPRLLGVPMGLERWAVEDEVREVEAFLDQCRGLAIPVVILGPSPASHSLVLDRVRRLVNRRFTPLLREAGVPFVAFPGADGPGGARLVRRNGRLTPAGHRFVADGIHAALLTLSPDLTPVD